MPTEGVGRFSFRRVLWGRSPHAPPGGLRPRTPASGAPTRSRIAPGIHPSPGPRTQAASPPRPARLGFACQSRSASRPSHLGFACQSRSAPGLPTSSSPAKAAPPPGLRTSGLPAKVAPPPGLPASSSSAKAAPPPGLRTSGSPARVAPPAAPPHLGFACQSCSAPGPPHLGFACQNCSRPRAAHLRFACQSCSGPRPPCLGSPARRSFGPPWPRLGSPTSSRVGPFPTSARLEDSRPEPLLAHPSRFGPPSRPAQPKPLRTGAPSRRSTPDTQLGSHSKSLFPGRLLRFRARSHFPPGHSSRSLPKLLPSEPHHELACPGFGARPRVAGRGHFAQAHPLDAASSPTPASARPRDVSSPPRSHFGSLISCCGRASLRTRRAGVARCSVAAQWVSPDHHPSGARIVRCSPSIAHRRRLCSGPPAAPHRVVAAACDSAGLASINRRTDRGNPEDAR
ncbi:hypothetical protein APR12_003703 [Nocardia amikacinitolerans]|nr:hypothetical protein [Nocardia amikacinitolerans]